MFKSAGIGTRMRRKRIVIVDDLPTMRRAITKLLKRDGRFDVVGQAGDAYEAREQINKTQPDAITLDVEMPGMNGLAFLEKIMRLRPMPVVMLSAQTRHGSAAAVEALRIGAVDCLTKPYGLDDPVLARLPDVLFAAANARIQRRRQVQPCDIAYSHRWNGAPVLIGASTGGVDALENLLSALPAGGPPILVTQHMPDTFLASLADRLDGIVSPRVLLAQNGMKIRPGEVYIAPGLERHLIVAGARGDLRCALVDKPAVEGHRPSVDALFHSAIPYAPRIVAVLLTGMGRDGAAGMQAIAGAGGETIAQDRESCVVFGMPRAAIELQAARQILPLTAIAAELLRITSTAEMPVRAAGGRP